MDSYNSLFGRHLNASGPTASTTSRTSGAVGFMRPKDANLALVGPNSAGAASASMTCDLLSCLAIILSGLASSARDFVPPTTVLRDSLGNRPNRERTFTFARHYEPRVS